MGNIRVAVMGIAMTLLIGSVCPIPAFSADQWGALMSVKAKTNIRAGRSLASPIRGSLMPGQTVKADFLKNAWYAVFAVGEPERSEKKALGYVYAPRLFPKQPPRDSKFGEGKGKQPAETRHERNAFEKNAEASVGEKPGQDAFPVVVKSIRYRALPGGKEVILLEFDRFYMPAVYTVEGVSPQIVMDVTKTASMEKEWSETATGGSLIQRIRASLNPASGILRIVLEMSPTKNYTVNPILYPDDKVYALEVTSAPAAPAAP